jgi:hypothetical protein
MSVDEARRLLLHDAARQAWGAEAALVLMEMLPPTGWADVTTKQDLERLAERLDLRIDRVEIRFDALRQEVSAQIADGQRRMMQWTVATMIAMTGLTTGIAIAIARLT